MLFGKSFSLGRYWGIDLRVDYSWFVIFFLIISSFSLGFLPQMYPLLSRLEYGLLAVALALLFFASVMVHEFAHALYAKRQHMRIDRMVFFLFGAAAEVQDESPTPRIEFIMAGVGPLTSYIIAVAFAGLWLAGLQSGVLYLQITGSTLALVNFAVATFNMLPAYPLDGGRLLRAIVWHFTKNLERSTRYASWGGRGFAMLLMFYGIWLIFSGLLLNGIWLIMLGFFLDMAATQSYTMVRLKQAYEHTRVGDYMEPAVFERELPTQLTPDDSLLDAFEKLQGGAILYVGRDNKPEGFITKQQLEDIARRMTR